MADAAMATFPVVGPAGVGLPTGGLEALKYAAQADAFHDDPNFYTWLDDWIGKQDDESIMIDAFTTLSDYGMQFEWQQQQQPKEEECDAAQPVGNSAPATDADARTCGASTCASLASHPSSQPSSDDTSLGELASPSNSSLANSGVRLPGVATSAVPFGTFGPATRGSAADPGPARASGNGGAGPFDAASFTMPLSRGLDALGLPPELSRLLGRAPDAASASLLEPPSPGASLPADHIPSHGTVTSYAGTPPSAAPRPAGNPPAAAAAGATGASAPVPALATATAAAAAAAGGVHGVKSVRDGLQSVGLLSVPSLEQLIARAICGNGSGTGCSAAGGGAAGGLGSLGLAVLGGALGHTTNGSGDAAAAAGGGGSGGGRSVGAGVGLAASASAPSLIRGSSSGSFGDGAADCLLRGMDEGSPCGSGRLSSQELPSSYPHQMQQLQQLQQSVRSAAGQLGGPGAGGGAPTSRLLGSRRKSSSSCAHLSSHGHGHHGGHGAAHHHHHHHHYGIQVSHAHGHAHVEKAGAAGGGVGGGGGGGWGYARGSGGVSASGKPTRSARTKAVFAALEAEVAGKLGELEALQQEHASLTQRVEILEVAVERQSAVLDLLTETGRTCTGGSAAAAAAAARPPDARSGRSAAADGGSATAVGPELLEWARTCTLETVVAWYKDHLQNLSLALLALEDSVPNPEAEMRLVQLVAAAWMRTSLVCIFQPLIMLRLKGLNLESCTYAEPSEQHWRDVIKFMTVSAEQIAGMENLFHSYNLLHGSFRAELQDTQADLAELVAAQDSISRDHCSKKGLEFVLQQTALLKRVRAILQKTHLLYNSTIGVAALRVLKPKEFAKCAVHSYPYYPCGPSLMKACAQLRSMKIIWGPAAVGCDC